MRSTFLLFIATGLAFAQTGDVIGSGNLTHIVANLDKSVAFYRDALGMTLSGPVPDYGSVPEIMKLGNTIGARNRMVVAKIPGSTLGVELIEYKDIERKAANPRFQDPRLSGSRCIRSCRIRGRRCCSCGSRTRTRWRRS